MAPLDRAAVWTAEEEQAAEAAAQREREGTGRRRRRSSSGDARTASTGRAGSSQDWDPADPATWARPAQAVRERERARGVRPGRDRSERTGRPGERPDGSGARDGTSGDGRRPERRRRRKPRRVRRAVLGTTFALLALVVVAGGILVASAYSRAEGIARQLQQVQGELTRARHALAHGQLPQGDPFNAASGLVADAQASIQRGGLPFRLVERLPLLGRPITDVKLATSAAGHLSEAATVARDMVNDLLGPAANARPGQVAFGPAAVFHDGTANIPLIRSLPGRFTQMLADLQEARSAFANVKPIPFVSRVSDAASTGLHDTDQALAVVRSGLSASRLLPSFLGADEPRTYFFAMQNNADQRATGGDILAFALVRARDGKLSLEGGGPIAEAEPRSGYKDVKLPDAIRWYLDHITVLHLRPRLQNINLSPDFPTVATAWHDLMTKGAKIPIDGVIAVDPFTVQAVLNRAQIKVPADPTVITSANAVREIENGQYRLSKNDRIAFTSQLIAAAWPVLSAARPFFKVVKELGTAFDQKHIQMWSAHPDQQALIRELDWSGAIDPGSGDYLATIDNKLKPNKVDFYTYTTLTYQATLDAAGTAHAKATVQLDNRTPADLSPAVVGGVRATGGTYALNFAQIGLFVPGRATWTGSGRLAYPTHDEGDARVFATNVQAVPGKPGVATFAYDVPSAVQQTARGRVYRLSIQHQPVANPQQLHVRITLPPGATVSSAPGWTVKDGVASFDGTLLKDTTLEIVF